MQVVSVTVELGLVPPEDAHQIEVLFQGLGISTHVPMTEEITLVELGEDEGLILFHVGERPIHRAQLHRDL